jgi:hypothetical protein
MHPPADPWGTPIDPVSPPPSYSRGSVPVPPAVPPRPFREPTRELPAVAEPGTRATPSRALSWQRTKSTQRRRLSDGWGFTAAGLIVAFCGWGLWAAAGRASGQSSLPGLFFMLAVATIVFVVSRYVGYLLLEKALGRDRPHARWAHFATGTFLVVSGIAYFLSSSWLVNGGDWIRTGLDWLGQHVRG